jgi:transcriptional regulator with XRE-family HTH domain
MSNTNSSKNVMILLRDKSGWSQKKIGETIGKTREMISYYESGKYRVPFKNKKLISLFKKFGMEHEVEAFEINKKTEAPNKKEFSTAAFIKLLERIDDGRKKRVIEFVKDLCKEEIDSLVEEARDFGT